MNIEYIKQPYYIIKYRKFNENNFEEMISLSIDLFSIFKTVYR
ncbi:MAG: hypothetical protein Q4E75_02350 [bacterium]|nr:hypothetical protein [bacterium]